MRRLCSCLLLVLCCAVWGGAQAALIPAEPGRITVIGEVSYVVQDPAAAVQPTLWWSVRGQQTDGGTAPLAGVSFAVVGLGPAGEEVPFPDPANPARPWVLVSTEAPAPLYLPLAPQLYLRQLDAPEGYRLPDARIPLSGETLVIDNLLSGGVAALRATAGSTLVLMDAQGGVWGPYAADGQGLAASEVLPEGTYTLSYQTWPDGCLPPDPVLLDIRAGGRTELDFVCDALPLLSLRAEEAYFDADGNLAARPLEGLSLVLEGEGERVTLRTGADGLARAADAAELPAVMPGAYVLTEADGTRTDFSVALNETYEKTFRRHDGHGQLRVQAWLATGRDAREPLAGARLEVADVRGRTYALTTDGQGQAVLSGLPEGAYRLTQEAVDNATVDAPEQAFEIRGGAEIVLEQTASLAATVRIHQQGIVLGRQGTMRLVPLAAAYAVYDAQGEWISDDASRPLPVTAGGTTYLFRQRTEIPGFAADTQVHRVDLYPGDSQTLQTLVYSNQGYFTLEHVSAEDGAPVAGGTFALYDASGELRLRFEADAQGRYASEQPLPAGQYTLALETAAEGYMAEAGFQTLTQPLNIPVYLAAGHPVGQASYASAPLPENLAAQPPGLAVSAQALALETDQSATVEIKLPALPLTLREATLEITLSQEAGVSVAAWEVAGDAAGARVWLCEDGVWADEALRFDELPAKGAVPDALRPITALRVTYLPAGDALPARFEGGVTLTLNVLARLNGDGALTIAASSETVAQYRVAEGQYRWWEPVWAQAEQTIALTTPNRAYHGFAFEDLNQNGRRDADERGLPGVSYTVLDSRGKVLESGTTDAWGGYALTQPVSGSMAWSVEALHAQTGTCFLLTDMDGADLPLVRAATLTGRVEGAPEGMTIALWNAQTGTIAVQTDAQGAFRAERLIPETYALSFELPEGYLLDAAPEPVTLPYGGTASVTRKLLRASTLSGRVQNEATGFGMSLDVLLRDAAGAVAAQTTSDAKGAYDFGAVVPGAYTLHFALPEGLVPVWGMRAEQPVALTPGGDLTMDLAVTEAAALEGVLAGQDGKGLSGRLVELWAEGSLVTQTRTDARGRFAFDTLQPHTYTLEAELPEGHVLYGNSPVVLAPGALQSVTRTAFLPARVSGLVWLDLDNNAYLSETDTFLADVPVRAVDELGNVLAEARTGSDGRFQLDRLPPGTLYLETVLPEGTAFATVPADPGLGRVFAALDTREGRSEALTLLPGQHLDTVRIGAVRMGAVRGTVWQDLDNDGLFGASEPLLAGVRVELWKSGALVAEGMTGEDGRYAFEALRPDSYTVMLTLPDGWVYGRRVSGAEDRTSHVAESDRAQAQYSVVLTARAVSDRSHAIGALPLAGIAGKAALTDGAPLSGVQVRLTLDNRTVSEAVTDAHGAFRFAGLRPGAYQLRYTLSPHTHAFEDLTAGASVETGIALRAGEERVLQVPKAVALGRVDGRVFGDLNDNGRLDAGEEGVSGVKVELWQNDARVAYAETARNGAFRFEGLRPGAYQITYTLPARYVAARDAALRSRFNLGMGEARVLGPIGCYQPGSISGTVWLDEDANGRMGSREAVLEGVTVALTRQGERVAWAVTGTDGRYAFENLAPGDYAVEAELPETLMFADGGIIPGVDASQGQSGRIRLEMGMDRDGQVIGAVTPGEVYGRCWMDSVYNGLKDEGEAPLADVMISLLDQDNAVVRQTQTRADGSFHLERVRPGTYRLHAILPEGRVFSLQAQGGNSMPALDARQGFGPYFTLEPGQLLEDRHVAAIRLGSIRGEAFTDLNNDGRRGLEEPGLPGTVIRLLDAQGALVEERTCPDDGTFAFEGLRPGNYTLSAQWPEGYVSSAGAGAERSVALAMGEESPRQFLGALLPGSIEGRVFEDLDADGYWGLRDPSMEGVEVTLLLNDSVLETAVTDAEGLYRFEGLMPGNYRLRFTLPTGYLFTVQRLRGSVTPMSDANEAQTEAFGLAMGDRLEGMSAGALRVGRLGDRLWIDWNGNGMQDDGEPGLADTAVELLAERDGVWTVAGTMITDADGYYWFESIRPGMYRIRLVCPEGYWPTKRVEEVPEINSKLPWRAAEVLESDPVTVRSGQDVWNLDAGFVDRETAAGWGWIVTEDGELEAASKLLPEEAPPSAPHTPSVLDPYAAYTGVVGLIWRDADANGAYDPGEPPIEGAVVHLYQIEGETETLLEDERTDAAGVYLLAWLPAGSYRLHVTLSGDDVFEDGSKERDTWIQVSGEDLLHMDWPVYRYDPAPAPEPPAILP